MLTISYSESRVQGTVSTWQRCSLEDKSLSPDQSAELERLTTSSGVLRVNEVILPNDAVLEGVHWTLIAQDDNGTHKIIGKSAPTPNLPVQDTDPSDDPEKEAEKAAGSPLNYDRLGELLQFLKPHLKSGFAAES